MDKFSTAQGREIVLSKTSCGYQIDAGGIRFYFDEKTDAVAFARAMEKTDFEPAPSDRPG